MKKRLVTTLLTLVFGIVATLAQDISENERTLAGTFAYDMGNVLKGMGYAYTRPLEWKGKQWGHFGATAIGVGSLFLVDEPVRDFMVSKKGDIPLPIREFGTNYGSPQVNYAATGVVYLTGLFSKNEKLRRTGVLLLSSASAAGLLQHATKNIIGRARPASGQSNDTFKPFTGDKLFFSFPSGHAILAMSNAHAIAKQFDNIWVKTSIYTIGSIPGFSRLWDDRHWISDVALSTVIAIFTVEAIDRYLDSKYESKYNDSTKNVSWNLTFGANQLGVSITF